MFSQILLFIDVDIVREVHLSIYSRANDGKLLLITVANYFLRSLYVILHLLIWS